MGRRGSTKGPREGAERDGGSTQRATKRNSISIRESLIDHVVSDGFKAGFGVETKKARPST